MFATTYADGLSCAFNVYNDAISHGRVGCCGGGFRIFEVTWRVLRGKRACPLRLRSLGRNSIQKSDLLSSHSSLRLAADLSLPLISSSRIGIDKRHTYILLVRCVEAKRTASS